jgi:tRNA threonylcarbamoyladenosine biosynthesis protein TsaB
MFIAIDTSTEYAGLALVEKDNFLAELSWHCGQNHTVELLPRLTDLLARAKLDLKQARGIIVALGPGSFNGLRVGLATAKGLALSLGAPIVGVSTLAVEAWPHAATGLPVCAIHAAGRGEIAAAVYRLQRGTWRRLAEERITTLDELCAQTTVKTLFCGEFIRSHADELKQRLGAKAVIPSPAANLRRPAFLAELGALRLQANDHDDVATLQPLYLRRPPITERKHH